ncbi:hypothetical protein HKI87_18g87820 [Chloropicon roscoffensis]|uniref:Uncharacterized protein n=1 Tax=Chloropicon roscoffensis TaxID=1461544 RepID=A0AAX4PLI6_9CHLO
MDCGRAAILISKDKRMKYAYAFDALMAVGALGCHFVVDGMLGECGKVACIYFLLVGTLSAYSYVAMDRGDIVHISVADNIGKLSLLLIGVATIALLVHVLSTVLEDKQRNQAAANKKRQEKEEEVKVGLTSRLAQDVMACKKGAPGLLKLLELDRSALHGYSPEDISEELSVAIRGLCSFVKLANATILASEVPIQILYEKHILDKEVAIAFHTMDDSHKKVMAATARLLEEYFTRGDDEEEEEGERESSKDK